MKVKICYNSKIVCGFVFKETNNYIIIELSEICKMPYGILLPGNLLFCSKSLIN